MKTSSPVKRVMQFVNPANFGVFITSKYVNDKPIAIIIGNKINVKNNNP